MEWSDPEEDTGAGGYWEPAAESNSASVRGVMFGLGLILGFGLTLESLMVLGLRGG